MTRNGHREIELKFELSSDSAEKVRRHALLIKADHDTRSQSTVYFDTELGEIHDAGYSLRVRQLGDCHIQTVKTNTAAGGMYNRGEWEGSVSSMEPDLGALQGTPLGKLKRLDGNLRPVVHSDVERTSWLVAVGDSAVEVVLDEGMVGAGNQETAIHELELELKDGDPAAMFGLAQQLGQDVPLEIGVLSKEERGRLLAQDAFGREHKASSLDIQQDMDVGQVFMAIAYECIRHFRLNEQLIVVERNPQALHQARVAMRRLRAAFALFRPAIRQRSLRPLHNELRRFIEPFGVARNLDVFLTHHGEELDWRDRVKLKSARADAYDAVIDALGAQRTRDMFLNLVEWTASEAWRKGAASEPIGRFAAKRFDAAWRKVKRRGRKLTDLKKRQLHLLRIDIKKLRYAVEFLAPLYRKKRVRKFTALLEKMQDCLGLVHDDMVSRQIIADFALHETAGRGAARRSRQLKVMKPHFMRLKRVGRFWAN